MLRYSVSVRFHFLMGMLGPALVHGGASAAPIATHDTRLVRTLAFLLTDPTASRQQREARAAAGLEQRVIQQAELRAKDGGLNLAGARLLWPAAHLSRASAVLPYLSKHSAAYCLDVQALDYTNCVLPYFGGLRVALLELHRQSPAAAASFPDLASLLSGSPRSQHDLAEGVFATRLIEVQRAQLDDRHRARLHSAGGRTWRGGSSAY